MQRRRRALPTPSPRWVLGLLSYHQNEHLGQMLLLKKLVTQG
ncbi:MAG TPA: hypothetical protein VK191_11530 [Symbiobacteriaceae bacterium]|nr:hypothetical protein [Symbiobacteriaceae bacterium]